MRDIKGQKFNDLVVVSFSHRSKWGQQYWRCICNCGNYTSVRYEHLKSGNIKTCGCKAPKPYKFTGKKFGRWTVIKQVPTTNKSRGSRWLCECDCGNVKNVFGDTLASNHSTSCGCYAKEVSRELGKKLGQYVIDNGLGFKPGCTNTKTHGEAGKLICKKTIEYNSWSNMIKSVTDPNAYMFKWVGAIGLLVCDRWLAENNGYANFLKDLGRRPSVNSCLMRKDIKKDFTPENCIWSTRKESTLNTRWHKEHAHEIKQITNYFELRTDQRQQALKILRKKADNTPETERRILTTFQSEGI